MYTNIKDVVVAVREKYTGATGLSRKSQWDKDGYDASYCVYSHEVNGIGCAVGCLFPAEVAASFDGVNHSPGIYGINDRVEFAAMFSPDLLNGLAALQDAHDSSQNVDEFIEKLDAFIPTEEWEPIYA